jgi:hypothetical protein
MVLVGRPNGKRALGTHGVGGCGWEDNTKMNLQEVGWEAGTGLLWMRIGIGGGRL